MTLSELCIRRPVMTTLITASIIAFGIFGFRLLPVSALPRVDFPTIAVSATLPGASADTMAASVAGIIERQLSTIAGISSMSSSSSQGTSVITIQFDLNRNIDAAALDVQTALTIAQRRLPIEMTIPPSFRKVNPADFPVLFVSLGSATLPLSAVNEYGDITIGQTLSQIPGVAQVADLRRAEIRDPRPGRSGSRRRARAVARRHQDRGVARQFLDAGRHPERAEAGRRAAGLRPDGQGGRLQQDRGGLAQRLAGQARRGRENLRQRRERQDRDLAERRAGDRARDPEAAGRQYRGGGRFGAGETAGAAGADSALGHDAGDDGPLGLDPSGGGRRRGDAADRGRAGHPGDLPVPALGLRHLHSGAGGSDLAARHLRGDVRARLFHQQHDAAGADALGRLRGRRRHRHAGEHRPPHRARHAAVRGRAEGRARDRLYDHLDHLLADRRVHSGAADGRHRRPRVPRIRGDGIGRDHRVRIRVADADADAVRARAAGA